MELTHKARLHHMLIVKLFVIFGAFPSLCVLEELEQNRRIRCADAALRRMRLVALGGTYGFDMLV